MSSTTSVGGTRLTRANAVLHGTEAVADVLVPATVALTVTAVGIRPSFVVIAATAVLSAVAASMLARSLRRSRTPHGAPEDLTEPTTDERTEGVLDSVRSGLAAARRSPMVGYAIAVLAVLDVFVVASVVVGGAALGGEQLGSSTGFGWLLSAFGLGSVAGLVVAARLGLPRRPAWVTAALVTAIGILLAVMGLADAASVVVLTAVGIGAAGGYPDVLIVSWLQTGVPDALLGRVMSLVAVAAVAVDPLGMALAGLLLGASTAALFLTCAVVVTACGVVGLMAAPVRRLS